MPRIYFPELTSLTSKTTITFPEKQAQHIRVLRLRINDDISLFNGQGLIAEATLNKIDKKTVKALVLRTDNAKAPAIFPIHLVPSVIRSEQMDFVIQKAVELGVKSITPIFAERSQGRPTTSQIEKKLNHWQEIIISAAEQSGSNYLPILNFPCTFTEFISNTSCTKETVKLILHPGASNSLQTLPVAHPTAAILLIGPEGGFTNTEMNQAKVAGFTDILLHQQILRAETAAIVATSLVQFHFL